MLYWAVEADATARVMRQADVKIVDMKRMLACGNIVIFIGIVATGNRAEGVTAGHIVENAVAISVRVYVMYSLEK